MTTKPYPGTQAVLRAVRLLKFFDDEHPEWGLGEIAEAAALNKTTTFRLLSALESEGMVARSEFGDRYTLGSEIVVLGGRALRANNLRSVSRPELVDLAAKTGETASVEILSGEKMLILDEVAGDRLLSGIRSIGTRWPVHVTSTGLVMLAFLPEDELKGVWQRPLPPITLHSITNHTKLRQKLSEIRRLGYAIADEQLELGFLAIGAPICNHDQEVIAAISLSGPQIRLTNDRHHELGIMVYKAAERISARLGSP